MGVPCCPHQNRCCSRDVDPRVHQRKPYMVSTHSRLWIMIVKLIKYRKPQYLGQLWAILSAQVSTHLDFCSMSSSCRTLCSVCAAILARSGRSICSKSFDCFTEIEVKWTQTEDSGSSPTNTTTCWDFSKKSVSPVKTRWTRAHNPQAWLSRLWFASSKRLAWGRNGKPQQDFTRQVMKTLQIAPIEKK